MKTQVSQWAECYTCNLLNLPAKHPLRVSAIRCISSAWWTRIINSLICVNCILLALDDPLQSPPGRALKIIESLNTAFTFLFFLEILVRIVALGFHGSPGSFTSDFFNIMDLLIVAASLADVAGQLAGFEGTPSFLTAFRVLRVAKLLRLVGRIPPLQQVISLESLRQ
jgi:hypothetical protein